MSVVAAGGIGAGATAFLVILGLIAVSVLLFMSMVRHLRKVPPTFEDKPDQPDNDDQPRPRSS